MSAGGDSPLAGVGLFLGFATAAAMLVVNAQRVLNLEYTDNDWPGETLLQGLITLCRLAWMWRHKATPCGGQLPLPKAACCSCCCCCCCLLMPSRPPAHALEYHTFQTPPGPKAWPAGMSLISFFELSVFWQAIFPLIFGKA